MNLHAWIMEKKSIWIPALLVLLIVFITPKYLDVVTLFGHSLPQPDMRTDYVKGIYWAIALGFSIFLWPVSAQDKKMLIQGWVAKSFVTLFFMLVYENIYALDATMYFEESSLEPFSMDYFDITRGTQNLINISRLHHEYLPQSYHAMKVTFAMLGLLGVYLSYRAGVLFLRREEPRVFYLLCFFPGILFWSSILGKDPLVFFSIALYCYGVVAWVRRGQFRYLIPIALGIAGATCIRQWLGIIMLLPLGVFLFVGISYASRLLFASFVAISLFLSADTFLERFSIETLADIFFVAESTSKGFVGTEGGSTQQLDVDLTSARGIITFVPVATFSALFRPLPGEVLNAFGILASLESAYLLRLLWLAVRRSRMRDLKEPLILWAILLVLSWAIMNGIISATNFGLAVRYRLQVLPPLLGVLLYLSRERGVVPAEKEEKSAAFASPAAAGDPQLPRQPACASTGLCRSE